MSGLPTLTPEGLAHARTDYARFAPALDKAPDAIRVLTDRFVLLVNTCEVAYAEIGALRAEGARLRQERDAARATLAITKQLLFEEQGEHAPTVGRASAPESSGRATGTDRGQPGGEMTTEPTARAIASALLAEWVKTWPKGDRTALRWTLDMDDLGDRIAAALRAASAGAVAATPHEGVGASAPRAETAMTRSGQAEAVVAAAREVVERWKSPHGLDLDDPIESLDNALVVFDAALSPGAPASDERSEEAHGKLAP